MNDVIAWFYEKNGIFTVRSAYRVAIQETIQIQSPACTSRSQDRGRHCWSNLWSTPVPQKIKIFGWRLANNGLATLQNRKRRRMEIDSTCRICGREEEDEFHAVISCTKAKALRDELRKDWDLVPENRLVKSGPEWFILLIDDLSMESRAQLLFCFWRAWHLRNNVIHGDGKTSVYGSAKFVISYWQSLLQIRHGREDDKKGKAPISRGWKLANEQRVKATSEQRRVWSMPPQGWIKLNVDAAFEPLSGETNLGMVIRDHTGKVLVSSWKHGLRCVSVEDAEAAACLEGIQLLSKWFRGPTVIDSDCHNVVSALKSKSDNRASFANMVKEIKSCLSVFPEVEVCKVGRECNRVAHELAQLAKRCMHSAVWRDQAPVCVHELLRNDCKPLSY
ncbi:unnamed protein product [Urochloa humidicola]